MQFLLKNMSEFNKKNTTYWWIFRRTLDYVSLNYVNGDWNEGFMELWNYPSDQLKQRLQNKIDHLIKVGKNKKKGKIFRFTYMFANYNRAISRWIKLL